MPETRFAEYAARNAAPILEILQREFSGASRVLEIGSGTGQHAVLFAEHLGHLRWQTSDLDENHAGIRAWIAATGTDNVLPPLSMDVREASVAAGAYDAVFSANTAHIMDIDAVRKMFLLVGRALRHDGIFCLYGPFRKDSRFNSPSNAAFDANLKARNPSMGIRDLETLGDFAHAAGLRRVRFYAVPSNNNVVVWQRGDTS